MTIATNTWSIKQWQNMFNGIYGERNKKCPSVYILLRLVEEVSEVALAVLEQNMKEIQTQIPDVLAWIFAFANKHNLSLEDFMVEKYAKSDGKGPSQVNLTVYISKREIPKTLNEWQRYLNRELFRNSNINIIPIVIVIRIFQDVGDSCRIIRQKGEKGIKDIMYKLAAVFAWTLVLADKFELDVAEITWGKYPNVCPKCAKNPCRCSYESFELYETR